MRGPVRARIPAGTLSGQRFRLKGRGIENLRTSTTGDHYYRVRVVTPTLLRPGPAAIAWSEKSWVANMLSNVRYASFTPVWNLLGWPAASVPFGVHPVSRTPTAVQIAGPPGAESAILGLAGEIERARAWERVADLS